MLRALKVMMKDFKISDSEELYVLPQPTEYCEQASQKVADNLVMTDAEWDEFHHDEETIASQRFINCSNTVTELETIAIDSHVIPMMVDLTHESDVPPVKPEDDEVLPSDSTVESEYNCIHTVETLLGDKQLIQCAICGSMMPGHPELLHTCIYQHRSTMFVQAFGTVGIDSE